MKNRFSPERFNQLYEYVENQWDVLTRFTPEDKDTLLALPYAYIVPGGIFEEMFYWDSYFTILGLAVQGRNELVKNMVDNFLYLMETYGIIPNANRTYYLSRSQPPYLTSMIKEVLKFDWDEDWLRKAFRVAEREYHEVWLTEGHITPTSLSRYYDQIKEGDPPCGIHHPAECESGWDRSPRFIEALNLNPIDLNCNLYRYEKDFAIFSHILGKGEDSKEWEEKALLRKNKIDKYMWDEREGFFYDYDYTKDKKTKYKTLASFQTLFSGLAGQEQAEKLVRNLSLFNQTGGLSISDHDYGITNMQWNYPAGWASTQWIVIKGLKNYGYHQLASDLTYKWLKLNVEIFEKTGKMWEKYNVVDRDLKVEERYSMQEGFGWTNGIFAALIGRIIFGLDYDIEKRQLRFQPCVPTEWKQKKLSITFSNYLLSGEIKIEL